MSHYLRESARQPVVISTDRGGDSRVLLGSELYNKLVEAYEDMQDRQELEERVAEDDGSRVGLSALRKKYGA